MDINTSMKANDQPEPNTLQLDIAPISPYTHGADPIPATLNTNFLDFEAPEESDSSWSSDDPDIEHPYHSLAMDNLLNFDDFKPIDKRMLLSGEHVNPAKMMENLLIVKEAVGISLKLTLRNENEDTDSEVLGHGEKYSVKIRNHLWLGFQDPSRTYITTIP